MKTLILAFALLSFALSSHADVGSFTVNGDFDKFYPVLWSDGAWSSNVATQLEIGRSDIHENSQWRSSLIMKLNFHTNNYGHGSSFIDASMYYAGIRTVAGWRDATLQNGTQLIVVWLRGGGTTYHYKSSNPTIAKVYDGVQNPLPFQEENGPALSFKTEVDSYVNDAGITVSGNVGFYGGGQNYFAGNVGIGTTNSNGFKLAVNGSIHTKSVTVDNNQWPDYVFHPSYPMRSLPELSIYIDKHKHLPEIPSAEDVNKNGVELGALNAKLLKKIEELTLYVIQINKELQDLKMRRKSSKHK